MDTETQEQINTAAMAKADTLKPAIAKKLGNGYVVYTRLIENGQLNYVEIAARPINGVPSDQRLVAFSCKYFAEMKDVPTMVERGRRIVKDLQTALGIATDESDNATTR